MQITHHHHMFRNVFMKETDVFLFLLCERRTSLAHHASMVKKLDRLLKTDRDQQADRDGGNVKNEAFAGIYRLVRRMNIEHG